MAKLKSHDPSEIDLLKKHFLIIKLILSSATVFNNDNNKL